LIRFTDRADAGRRLAAQLGHYANRHDVIVLALPRGGVPVGAEVARALAAPLDVFLVRKLGVPGHPELAMGAIASGGVRVVSDEIVRELQIPTAIIDAVALREQIELERRDRVYRGDRAHPSVDGRTVILVDDGLATGATMQAAVQAIRTGHPARVVVAVPVGAPETCIRLRDYADEVVCTETPESFQAVGSWYEHFDQTTDEEVLRTLAVVRSPA
jgi:predicted phosphoribosyltransferase